MIIKKKAKKKKISFSWFTKFLYFYFVTSILVASILMIAIFQSQLFINKRNTLLDYFSKAGRYEYLYLPQIAFRAIKSNFYKLEKLDLKITFENTLILENLRDESILSGRLPPADKMPKIKTKIVYNQKEYSADIRLKGDRKAHFIDKEKSSYKFELDRNQYLFGIKKFSLQKPRVRNYIHEWIFHEMSKEQGIIKLKYDFLELSINGDDKGLYVIEEGFGKELIERNKRRNGPIFSIDEDIYGLYDKPVFEIYNKKFWQRPENNLIANIASQKLHDFFDNKSDVDEVFDIEKWAAYFSVVDLTANYHGAFLKSVKLYYNPLNGLFEPIPFDGHRLKPNYNKYNMNYDNRILIDIIQNPVGAEISEFTWLKKFFYKNEKLNQKFYNLYSSYLNKISSKQYIDNFLSKNLNRIEEINSHIYSDYFFYDNSRNYGIGLYYFSIDDFYYHAENIQNKLKIRGNVQILKQNKSEFLVKNFYKNYGLQIANKLICNNNNKIVEISINKNLNNFIDTAILVPEKKIKNMKCTHINFINKFKKISTNFKIDYLNSKYSYDSFKNLNSEAVKNYFIKVDNNLFLKSDEIEIDTNLYIPRGLNVVIKQGQKILLTNNAFIISNSPWRIGGKEKLTTITGKKNNLGGGILITDTNKLSKIQNTKISYLTGYDISSNNEYLILGSINFNQTNVEIDNTHFKNILSEDAINIFRSNFIINNVNYKDIFSDAIDIDFSEGEINKARFININNDALDFSGSKVTINDTYFNNVRDKLISVGEESNVKIYKVKGINSYAGIISKDGSEVYSDNINFDGVKIPFAAYQKKKEYSNASLIAKNYTISNFLAKSIKDKVSKILINDKSIEIESNEILPIIYEKKLSLIKQ